MSLELRRDEKERAVGLVADRRLYLTADKERVVEDGDAAAAFLLAPEGTEIDAGDVARLGLSVVDGKLTQGTPDAAEAAPETAEAETPSDESTPARGRTTRRGGR